LGTQVHGFVNDVHLDLDLDGVGDSITRLETRGELGAAQQDGAVVVAPGAEASVDKVLGVAVLLGHFPETLSVDVTRVGVARFVDCTARAVDDDPDALDAQVSAQVEHRVGTVHSRRGCSSRSAWAR